MKSLYSRRVSLGMENFDTVFTSLKHHIPEALQAAKKHGISPGNFYEHHVPTINSKITVHHDGSVVLHGAFKGDAYKLSREQVEKHLRSQNLDPNSFLPPQTHKSTFSSTLRPSEASSRHSRKGSQNTSEHSSRSSDEAQPWSSQDQDREEGEFSENSDRNSFVNSSPRTDRSIGKPFGSEPKTLPYRKPPPTYLEKVGKASKEHPWGAVGVIGGAAITGGLLGHHLGNESLEDLDFLGSDGAYLKYRAFIKSKKEK